MASIDDAIYARLAASSGLSRVYNLQAAQGVTTPFTVFTVIPSNTVDSLDGVSTLTNARLQIDSYAADKDGAVILAEAARLQIAGFRGDSVGVYITRCLGPRTGFPTYESETRLYREMREYSLGYLAAT